MIDSLLAIAVEETGGQDDRIPGRKGYRQASALSNVNRLNLMSPNTYAKSREAFPSEA